MVEEFWNRWKRVSAELKKQTKMKWSKMTFQQKRHHVVEKRCFGHNQWPLLRITDVSTDRNGDVSSIVFWVADSNNGNKTLRQPITKTVILVKNETDSPRRKPFEWIKMRQWYIERSQVNCHNINLQLLWLLAFEFRIYQFMFKLNFVMQCHSLSDTL